MTEHTAEVTKTKSRQKSRRLGLVKSLPAERIIGLTVPGIHGFAVLGLVRSALGQQQQLVSFLPCCNRSL